MKPDQQRIPSLASSCFPWKRDAACGKTGFYRAALKRARRASKRKKTFLAITLGTLAAAEFTSWLVLDTAGFLLMLAGGLAIAAGALALTVTGRE